MPVLVTGIQPSACLGASGQIDPGHEARDDKGKDLHMVDAVALVHAMILRIQALVFPIKTLVLSGH